MKKTTFINHIKAGDKIGDLFICTEKNSAFSQKGSPYLNLRLRDRTGEMDAKIWDNVDELDKRFKKGEVVFVQGRAVSYKNAIQLQVLNIRRVEEAETEPADYLPTITEDPEILFMELKAYMERLQSPHLRRLLEDLFTDERIRRGFLRAPAAKGFHHYQIGGLLEHTLSVVRLVHLTADHYKGLNGDLLIAGAILHDIGKIDEFSYQRLIEYTDEGRLIGHIVIGLRMVDEKIAAIEGFPADLALGLRHILVSHHGDLEFGSPKRPKTLEALIVHYIDDLDAKVNAFRETIANAEAEDSPWTPYHRLLERYIYKGS